MLKSGCLTCTCPDSLHVVFCCIVLNPLPVSVPSPYTALITVQTFCYGAIPNQTRGEGNLESEPIIWLAHVKDVSAVGSTCCQVLQGDNQTSAKWNFGLSRRTYPGFLRSIRCRVWISRKMHSNLYAKPSLAQCAARFWQTKGPRYPGWNLTLSGWISLPWQCTPSSCACTLPVRCFVRNGPWIMSATRIPLTLTTHQVEIILD